MKKIIALLLPLCMLFCLAACGIINTTNTDVSTESHTQSSETKGSEETTNTLPEKQNPTETAEPSHTHSFSDATCTKAPTCSCGAENGSALGHSFTQGKCSRCGVSDPNYNPVSISKQNALKKAETYLNFSAFSYLGLINQLEFEKFSHEDAVYGADNCGANWNEQALKKAKSYLDFSAFSYSGLIDQLEFEKFTAEQAKYGADNCGANWNEQAAKKAESYLKTFSFSRQGLIDQLEFEGFTYEQAVYGVNSVGL